MKISRKTLIAITLGVVFGSVPVVQQMRSESRVQALLSDGGVVALLRPLSREDEVARYQGQLRLNALGGENGGSPPTAEVVNLLHSSSPVVQSQALHLLGRFEDPEALPALREKLAEQHLSLEAQVAVARVEARDLRGRAKLEAIANRIGLTWNEVLLLSQRANDGSYHPGYSTGDHILDEMVDVIGSMEERGEPIENLANVVLPQNSQLSNCPLRLLCWSLGHAFLLDRTQSARVQAAPLQEAEEIRLLLDYLGGVRVLRGQEYSLMAYIAGMGPEVPTQMVAKLEEIAQHPHRYYGLKPIPGRSDVFYRPMGLDAIMSTCGYVLDPQVIDKLQQMESRPLPLAVRGAAKQTSIEMRNRITYLGALPRPN